MISKHRNFMKAPSVKVHSDADTSIWIGQTPKSRVKFEIQESFLLKWFSYLMNLFRKNKVTLGSQ